jgi:signal transduction histidine kinase
MHFLLVPELGRHGERVVAEAVTAVIVGGLAAFLMRSVTTLRETTIARLQVIAEMNHHIRNALAAISLSAYVIEDQQAVRFISEAVNRIEWALREILPRDKPAPNAKYAQPSLDKKPEHLAVENEAPSGTTRDETLQ